MMMINDNNNYNCNYNNEDDENDTSKVVKLGKEKLLQCLTCPLCLNLFSYATTISECLHTFCRQCIYDKIQDEDLDCCPVCDIDLGGVPVDKLRADHKLQDLRTKLFPLELKKFEAVVDPEPSFPLPVKPKERSLASLVANSPPKTTPQLFIDVNKKYSTTTSLVVPREPSPPLSEEMSKKAEDCSENLSSEETLSKEASVNGNQKMEESTSNESPKRQVLSNDVEENGSAETLNPPNRVIESMSEGTKANIDNEKLCEDVVESVSVSILNGRHDHEHDDAANGRRRRKCCNGNESTPSQSSPVTRKKMHRRRGRRETLVSEIDPSGSTAVVQSMEHADRQFLGKMNPIWFSLIASNQQDGNEPLPQISSCYLRVKDGSLTVSLVKKYVAKKLDLTSDSEVEITLRGQPLIPTLQLHKIVDLWVQTSSITEVIPPPAGSSGKDIMLVLTYSRNTRPSQ